MSNILSVVDCQICAIELLLSRYDLKLELISKQEDIPGSYWGESEAGLISNTIYVRKDTPIHSLLHETCHYICMDSIRRQVINTNAEGDYEEENGVCYLQILLADSIPEMGQKRMMEDMDSWGYTFRLGSAEAWFKQDAEDAFSWLKEKNIISANGNILYQLRE